MPDEGEKACADAVEVERFSANFIGERGVKYFDIAEFLEGETSRATDPLANFVKIFFLVNTGNDGCPEFIVVATPHNDASAFLEASDINVGIARSERIFLRHMFDVHCPEINQLGFGEPSDDVGEDAVGVELHQESHVFYLSDELFEIVVKCWLAAGDANAIELAYSFLEKVQKFIGSVATCFRKVFFAWLDKLRVVTKWATQNTADRKHRCSEFPGIIEKGQRLVAGDIHNAMSLQF